MAPPDLRKFYSENEVKAAHEELQKDDFACTLASENFRNLVLDENEQDDEYLLPGNDDAPFTQPLNYALLV